MPRKAIGDERTPEQVQRLEAIVDSVRQTFRTVEDMTQAFIREAIVSGVFQPGQRLNLDVIAATLGVSRMPVRASLRQLETEGLVQMSPHRGARVTVLTPAEMAEIYEMRIVLECYLLEQLMPRIDDAFVDQLETMAGQLEDVQQEGPRLRQRSSFYATLYERAGRPRTLAQVNALRGSVGRYLLLQRVHEHHGHEDLVRFLRARDVAGAQGWLTAHLQDVSRELQAEVIREAAIAADAADAGATTGS